MLCTLLFQMVAGGYEWNSECSEAIDNVAKNIDGWSKYRIARSAARYGHHIIATEIFKSLKEAVASEQLHFWLSGLELVTKAECCLMYVLFILLVFQILVIGRILYYYIVLLYAFHANMHIKK